MPKDKGEDENLGLFFITNLEIARVIDDINGPLVQLGRPFSESVISVFEKGAMFVRMLMNTWGTEQFRKLIHQLLSTYEFQSLDTKDFFQFLDKEENPFRGVNVSTVLESWAMQEGQPIVTVTRHYEHLHFNQLSFQQESYQLHTGVKNNTNLWYIPIQYNIITYNNGKYNWISPETSAHFLFLMRPTKSRITHTVEDSIHVGPKSAVIVNVNYNGQYHVIYGERNWKNIGSVLMQNHQLIPAGTRIQLLDLLHRQNGLTNFRGNVAMKLCIGEYVQVNGIKCQQLHYWYYVKI